MPPIITVLNMFKEINLCTLHLDGVSVIDEFCQTACINQPAWIQTFIAGWVGSRGSAPERGTVGMWLYVGHVNSQ